jgi:hypothetical protein
VFGCWHFRPRFVDPERFERNARFASAPVATGEAAQPAQPAAAPAEAKTYPLPDPEPGAEPPGG